MTDGDRLVAEAMRDGDTGRILLEVAVAVVLATAPACGETDGAHILALYDRLLGLWSSAVVALNRAVRLGMADGTTAPVACPRPDSRKA